MDSVRIIEIKESVFADRQLSIVWISSGAIS